MLDQGLMPHAFASLALGKEPLDHLPRFVCSLVPGSSPLLQRLNVANPTVSQALS
jgi:hypothetical protein